MSDYVEIVIDKDVLDSIVERGKLASFLIYWINENETKAVTLLRHWKEFFKEWEEKLKKSSDDIKQPFFAFIRGVVSPYREKYAVEVGLCEDKEDKDVDDITATIKIINRHYATVKFVVVGNPENYKKKEIKINKERIVTMKDFFLLMKAADNKFVQRFLGYYSV